jgi:DNA-binding transcriptional regulator YdaS (Cro superfamily)
MDHDELRDRLTLAGRSQSWLADQLGVRPNTVHRWANGSMPIPAARDETILKLLPLAGAKS